MLGRSPISGVSISGAGTAFIPTTGIPRYSGWRDEERDRAAINIGRRRTREEIQAERERLGIVPKAVAKVIDKVAERKIAEPELVIEAALHRELERKALAYRTYYAEVLRLEIEELKAKQIARAEIRRDVEFIELQRRDEEEMALVLLM